MSSEDGMECPVCWTEFDDAENAPHVLWCGHSLCRSCVVGLQTAVMKFPFLPLQLPLLIACPWCQFLTLRMTWKGTLRYPCKNFFLLWIVESLKGQTVRPRPSIDAWPAEEGSSALVSTPHRSFPAAALTSYPPPLARASRAEQQRRRPPPPPGGNLLLELTREGLDWVQWDLGVGRLVASFMQFTAKLPLVLIFLFIVCYVVPFSTVVLALYTFFTVVFAVPSVLAVYFSFPTLDWLAREIAT